ncbi:hypothetical protein HZH66_014694 [Vespula vulgaris]|uniref:MATH domain-containing protein n=1 Tax=Vespula vulgaris TaxID=7454 RepID=A0A834MQL6_VESVU|nr:hypothetical protein HZH66_014694 [Vespula vulgaris]
MGSEMLDEEEQCIVKAKDEFKKQLEIITKEGTSLTIALVLERPIWCYFIKLETAVRGNGRDLAYSKEPNVNGFSWRVYAIVLRKFCRRGVRSSTRGKGQRGIDMKLSPGNYILLEVSVSLEMSSASKISPQFYDYLFTPSNINASYEAYSRTTADKSLSLYLSGLKKPLDVCGCTSFP